MPQRVGDPLKGVKGTGTSHWDTDAGTDQILAALHARPVRIVRPQRLAAPFIFASPHSGRQYPPSFVATSRLSPLSLRRSEDAYVDELFGAAASFGCPLVTAQFPRAYVDVNRAVSEIDDRMFDAALTVEVDAPSARVHAGLGVIPRVVREGAEIYRGKLDPADAEERLARLYRPYHAALASLIEETFLVFGCAVIVDCHSMPSTPAAPAIVFGDCYGESISPSLLRHAETAFEACGFSTACNAPYAGGFTTHHYARREAGIHSLQIEVNRGLYLDEELVEKTPRFAEVRERITAALHRLVAFDVTVLRPRRPLAAE
jgi:N-formylglutamate amidohydrolase